ARSGRPWSSRAQHRPVADAAHRRDVARPIGIIAELVAEPADVDVDGPVERLRRTVAVKRIEKRVARMNAALSFCERPEQAELRRGHQQRMAVAAGFVAVAVDLEVTEPQRLPRSAAAGSPQ